MNKQAKVKYLFRQINSGLQQLEKLPRVQRVATIDGLMKVNEELCDYVLELVKKDENDKRTTGKCN